MDLVEIDFNNIHETRHPWELSRQAIVEGFIKKYTPTKSNHILDIGSGDAFLANGFTQINQSKAYCVDIEYTDTIKDNINRLFNNERLSLYSSLDDLSQEVQTIDTVTLLDVIEHVPDDVALLSEIISKPFINEDTHFIITVPAYQGLFCQHDKVLKHYRRYDLGMLKNTADKSGLKIIDKGYFFASLLVPRMLTVFAEKMSKPKEEGVEHLGTWQGGSFVTNAIKNTLLLDYKLGKGLRKIGLQPPGLSCYAICKKA